MGVMVEEMDSYAGNPGHWGTYRLQDLVDRDNPIAYGVLKPGDYVHNGIPLLQIRDVIHGDIDVDRLHRISEQLDRQYSRTKLTGGEVVVSLVGTIGRVAHIPPNLAGGNLHRNLARIFVSEWHDAKYVYYFLNSDIAQSAIKLTTFGSTQALLNLGDLRNLQVIAPLLAEQKAIATALSDVDALLGALDRLIAKKRELKQAAMQQLLTGQTRLPGFSGKWETKHIGEFARIRNDKVLPEQVDPDMACVELEHIGQGDGRLYSCATASDSTSSKYRFRTGDVLFGRLRPYLRKYWLADRDGICSTEIWPLAVEGELAFNGFLHAVVQTPQFVDAASVAYGTHMPRADWGIVKNFAVHLPPVDEQRAVAAVLVDIDAEINALEQRRDKTRLLKQGMMQELLTGKTRLV